MKTTLLLTITLLIFSASVNGQTAPIANFSCDTISTNPCCLQFTDLSTNSPTLWFWDFWDGTASTLQNPSHCFVVPGIYYVTLIDSNTWGKGTITKTVNTTTCNCTSTVGLTDIEKEKINAGIYPNPAKNEITIEIDAGKVSSIKLYNIKGQSVREISDTKNREIKISVVNLPKGIYFVKLFDKEGKELSAEKIILQ